MIGAGIAVLTGIGAGLGIGIATSKATEATGRSNRYLWFRCCTADGHYEVKGPPSESERKEHGFSWKKL